jgi:8-oxo-dGTP pyrophosphatase MutT (NUDIX family)
LGPIIPTVRLILECNNRYLVLQKSPDSNAPGLWEFPGGKIKGLIRGETEYNRRVIQRDGVREGLEETGIDLHMVPLLLVDSFKYVFKRRGDSREHDRLVFVMYGRLDTMPEVVINATRKPDGTSEDKHAAYKWVTKRQLLAMRRRKELLGNSVHFDHALKHAPRSIRRR